MAPWQVLPLDLITGEVSHQVLLSLGPLNVRKTPRPWSVSREEQWDCEGSRAQVYGEQLRELELFSLREDVIALYNYWKASN